MHELNGKALHARAKDALSQASFPPQKILLVYILATLLSSLVLDLLSYYIGGVVDNMTQLSDWTRRSSLSSLVMTLSVLVSVFSVFWSYSYTIFALRASRKADFSYDTLWEGFRLWKRVIGAVFWPSLRYLGLSFVYISIGIPFLLFSLPSFILCTIAYVALMLYFSYRYWAVHFLAIDNTVVPTVALCAISSRMMEGRKWQIFKVELHFLWYYALIVLVQAVPSILVMYAQSFALYLCLVLVQVIGLFLLYMWKFNEMNVTFAMAYNTLLESRMPESRPEGPQENYLPENTEQ